MLFTELCVISKIISKPTVYLFECALFSSRMRHLSFIWSFSDDENERVIKKWEKVSNIIEKLLTVIRYRGNCVIEVNLNANEMKRDFIEKDEFVVRVIFQPLLSQLPLGCGKFHSCLKFDTSKEECSAFCFCRRQARHKQRWQKKPHFKLVWSNKKIPCVVCKRGDCQHHFLSVPSCDKSSNTSCDLRIWSQSWQNKGERRWKAEATKTCEF